MAVYTDVTADDLTEFLAATTSASCSPTRASPRAWRIPISCCTPRRRQFHPHALREARRASDLPFFLGLMEHLASRGITCPQPVKNRNGGVLGKLAGRPAAIVTFLDGLWIRRPNAGHCAAGRRGAGARCISPAQDFPLQARQRAVGRQAGGRSTSMPATRADSVQPGLCDADRQGARRAGEVLAARPAGRRDPCRSLSRQRVLPRRQAVRADRLLFRLHRHARL